MRSFLLGAVAAAVVSMGVTSPSVAAAAVSGHNPAQLPNLDASPVASAATASAFRARVAADVSRFGYRSDIDSDTGTTFIWAGKARAESLLQTTLTGTALHEARARDFLRRYALEMGLSASAIRQARMHDLQDAGSGPVIARFRQQADGMEVFGRDINVLMSRQGRLVAISGLFAADSSAATAAAGFRRSAQAAVGDAFADLGGRGLPSLATGPIRGEYREFKRAQAAGDVQLRNDPRAKKVLFPMGEALIPAYYLELSASADDGHRQMDYGYVISATDGKVLMRKDQSANEAFTYRMFASGDGKGQPFDEPLGNGFAPFSGTTFDATIERSLASSRLVTLNASPLLSTGDPWLPAGATATAGNNVDAYLDRVAPDGFTAGSDLRASVTAPNVFDHPLVGDVDPSSADASNSAVVNLFFMNNFLHDFWYDRGFNEAAGNAQKDNYGRGGAGNDPIHAEGQDFSGRNNANMSTPADGRSPTMQMYLFDGLPKGKYLARTANNSESIVYSTADFGPVVFDVRAALVTVNDGVDTTTDGCTAPLNAADLAGKIALVDRGNCDFTVKVFNAQQAGAIGVTIVNNVAGAPVAMGGTNPAITVGTMMITQEDGEQLKGAPVQAGAHMLRKPSTDLDGTIDEAIVSHEFFHYVSNRLVGNGSGLINNQGSGMGEGWSDFNSMLMQVRPSDKKVRGNHNGGGAYAVGTYVTNSFYFGIRRAPYSTDFAKNPLTFKHIQNGEALPLTAPLAFGQDGASNAEVHNTGEIWCNMLWEAYEGFLKDDRYNFEQARAKVQEYVIAGLKMTPGRPTMIQARDGILAAADASNDQDFIIWANAFAKRGMGVDAKGPSSLSFTNKGVTESYVPATPTP